MWEYVPKDRVTATYLQTGFLSENSPPAATFTITTFELAIFLKAHDRAAGTPGAACRAADRSERMVAFMSLTVKPGARLAARATEQNVTRPAVAVELGDGSPAGRSLQSRRRRGGRGPAAALDWASAMHLEPADR